MQTCEHIESMEAAGRSVLDAASAWCHATNAQELTPTEAARILKFAVQLRNQAESVEMLVTARAAEAPEFAPSGSQTTEDKMGRATGKSSGAAKRRRKASESATKSSALTNALRDGSLSGDQAEQIAEAVKNNPDAAGDLIDKAKNDDAKGLRDACGRSKAAGDRDADARRERIRAGRRLTHWSDPDGSRCGRWQMLPEDAGEIEHILDGFTERIFNRARQNGLRESHDAYRADAMLAMARAAANRKHSASKPRTTQGDQGASPAGSAPADLSAAEPAGPEAVTPCEPTADHRASPATPFVLPGLGEPSAHQAESCPAPSPSAQSEPVDSSGADDPDLTPVVPREMVLRCDYSAFMRGYPVDGETCEIDGLGPVPVAVAHEFLNDCFLKAIICDGTDIKRVAHYGRKIPAVLRTALADRDRVCSEPGCNKSIRLELDHNTPVAQGGIASLDGLDGLCTACHKTKTKDDNRETRRLKRTGRLVARPPNGAPIEQTRPVEPAQSTPSEAAVAESSCADPTSGPAAQPQPLPDWYSGWREEWKAGRRPPNIDPFSGEGARYQ